MNTIKYFSRLRSSFFAFFILGLFLQSVAIAVPPLQRSPSVSGKRSNPPVAHRVVEQRESGQPTRRWVQSTLGIQNGRWMLSAPVSNAGAAAAPMPMPVAALQYNATASAAAQANTPSAAEDIEISSIIYTSEDMDELLEQIRNLGNPSLLKKLRIEFRLPNSRRESDISELHYAIKYFFRDLTELVQNLEILDLDLAEQSPIADNMTLETIGWFLRANLNLREFSINLMRNKETNSLVYIVGALKKLNNLHSFSIYFVENMDDITAYDVFQALGDLKNLQKFKCLAVSSEVDNSQNSMKILMRSIINLRNLTEIDLDLSQTSYTGDEVLVLIQVLKRKKIKFRLDLSNSFALEEKEDALKEAIGDPSIYKNWSKDEDLSEAESEEN